MDLSYVYGYLNAVLNRHESGNSFSPKEFNYVLALQQRNFLKHLMNDPAINIQKLITAPTTVALTTGVGDLPADFLKESSAYYVSGSTNIPISILDDEEFTSRLNHPNKAGSTTYPIARIRADDIEVSPTSITSMKLSYMKLPDDPYFDYYIDANRNIIYIAEGGSVDLGAITGTYRDGSTTGTHASISKELAFDEYLYDDFCEFVLEKLGIRAEKTAVIQTSEMERQIDRND